jgi:hypothetical protein
MLETLAGDHRGISRLYYLDVPFPETLVRHATKQDAEYLAHVNRAGTQGLVSRTRSTLR